MVHVFVLMDRPGAADLRTHVRPEHKAYLAQVAHRIAFAGPLLADDGETMIGSLLAIDFDSRWEALRLPGAVRKHVVAIEASPDQR